MLNLDSEKGKGEVTIVAIEDYILLNTKHEDISRQDKGVRNLGILEDVMIFIQVMISFNSLRLKKCDHARRS